MLLFFLVERIFKGLCQTFTEIPYTQGPVFPNPGEGGEMKRDVQAILTLCFRLSGLSVNLKEASKMAIKTWHFCLSK